MLKVLVFEFFPYHAQNFPMYPQLLPELLGTDDVSFEFYAVPEQIPDLIFPQPEHLHRIYPSTAFESRLKRLRLNVPYLKGVVALQRRKYRPDCIVFNTLEPGATYRTFAGIKATKKIGILHNPDTARFAKDANTRYLCMNEYIYQNLRADGLLDGYLLSFFPPLDLGATPAHDGIVVGIPGGISFNRRDYHVALDAAAIWKASNKPVHVTFNVIGEVGRKDGRALQEQIRSRGLERYFIFHERLTDADFAVQVHACDYLLPLVGGQQERYLKVKNSATFSHSARYLKPMVLPVTAAREWDLSPECCITYENTADLAARLASLPQPDPDIQKNYAALIARKLADNRAVLRAAAF